MDKQGWGRSLRFVEFEECKRAEPKRKLPLYQGFDGLRDFMVEGRTVDVR
jgi:hypothetical protein